MMRIYYCTLYSYNAGTLGTSHFSDTAEQARAFEENYIKHFIDCDKYFITYKVTAKKTLLGEKVIKSEKIRTWWEE